MRLLNRIVFINSANIPYAEIRLDGNVHLEGTQGVGKSTVLRALLFFYNADKLHLGIQPGQKPFELFYYPSSNSYIVYEVTGETGPYTVITMRSQGRVVYRFVDSGFDRAWFFGDGTRAESDWPRIRERIQESGAATSPLVGTYEQYRDIIFGNTRGDGHRFDRYAIVRSQSYQNIPRSIQNVFLNSKLDANFVKQTVIQSMSDTEISIELSSFRSLLQGFEAEFAEIDCWYRKEKNGTVLVREKANRVTDGLSRLRAFRREARSTWHQLNTASAESAAELPLVTNAITVSREKLKAAEDRRSLEADEYRKEHDRLVREISSCDLRLKDIREKRKRYEELGIGEMLALELERPETENALREKEETLRALESQYQGVAEKYRALTRAVEDEVRRFGLTLGEELVRRRERMSAALDVARKRSERERSDADASHEAWLEASDARLESLRTDAARADKLLAEVRYLRPLEKEISSLEAERLRIGEEEQKLESALRELRIQKAALQREGESKLREEKESLGQKLRECEKNVKAAKDAEARAEAMLGRWKGSLYEWLSENRPGWEETIGKVVDEESVLYASGLDPEATVEGEGSLYGVKLDLRAIPRHHRTPDDLRRERDEAREKASSLSKELARVQEEGERALERIQSGYRRRISEISAKESETELRLQLIPSKRKDAETRLRAEKEREAKMVEAVRAERTAKHDAALIALEGEKEAREKEKARHQKILKAIRSEFEKSRKTLEASFSEEKASLDAKRKEKAEEGRQRVEELKAAERAELQGVGADTRAIDGCRKAIESLKEKIALIERQHDTIVGYRKDEEELFSHEAEFRARKQALTASSSQAENRFRDRQRKRREEEEALRKEIDAASKRKDLLETGLRDYERMRKDEGILPEALLEDTGKAETALSCRELVAELRTKINRTAAARDQLVRDVDSFRSHFPANTLHFPPIVSEADYEPYAVNLSEFLAEGKLELQRKRMSEHYANLLASVSREAGNLMSHMAEVSRVVKDINDDFERRGGFSGVIRGIEMRIAESSDRMMRLLLSIHDFTEENRASLGEPDLFSGGDSDRANLRAVEYLKQLLRLLRDDPARTKLTLGDTFRLQFRVRENNNDTGWVERITNVGSDGTDILVKAMVNIMLISVFKERASRKKDSDFVLHCMMDEIGKLHPSNVKGLLQFANDRNICLINGSPMGFNADLYKYNYILRKDAKALTHVHELVRKL